MKHAIRGATVAAVAIAALAAGSSYALVSGQGGDAAPIFGITIPAGYRDWRLISVAREEGHLDDLRFSATTSRSLPTATPRAFPDGTIISRLA